VAKAPTARRYAQALFAIAQEKSATEAWLNDLRELADVLDDPTISAFMSTPRVRTADKLSVVAQMTEGRDPMIANLVGLLTSRQGAGLMRKVANEYGELLNVSLGRIRAQVTTAQPMSAAQLKRLSDSLGASLNKEVLLEAREDPEIIGGVLVRVGDQIIDGSVRTKLVSLKQQLAHGSLT
jgi:F-type H+-transporting ATPase subunit delta